MIGAEWIQRAVQDEVRAIWARQTEESLDSRMSVEDIRTVHWFDEGHRAWPEDSYRPCYAIPCAAELSRWRIDPDSIECHLLAPGDAWGNDIVRQAMVAVVAHPETS